ncbi:lipid IV(A) 4-amino-4-deoxy-L-arabinosyltransferase, partial [Providencia rettgeri]
LPWALVVASRGPDYWNYFFWAVHIQRFMADNAQNKSPFWFYIPILLAAVLPWLGYLFGAIHYAWRQKGIYLYFLLWFIAPFVFFSITKGKLLTYILPCIAPVAILMAAYIEKVRAEKKTTAIRLNAVINLLVGGAAAALIIASPYIPKINIYQADESNKLWLAAAAFICWLLVALVSFKQRFWYF